MDAQDLFKKLTTGAKFNLQKYLPEAKKLKIVRTNPWPNLVQLRPEAYDTKDEKEEDHSVMDNSNVRPHPELTLLGSIKASHSIMHKEKLKKNKKKEEQNLNLPQDKSAVFKVEEVHKIRNYHRISVKGHKVAPPFKTFEQLQEEYGVSSLLLQNLQAAGYKQPTPIQMQAIPIMLQGRQILACAPTGSGKTAAFLVPIIHHLKGPRKLGFRAVIVSPTRELAKQTYRECHRLAEGTGLRINIISKTNQAANKFGPQSSQKFDVLVTTPNRLIYLLQQDPPVLNLHSVEWLVIDESDKLFEAGPKGFREQLAIIYNACDSNNVKRAMFSATHTVHVARWARKNLKGLISVTIGHSFEKPLKKYCSQEACTSFMMLDMADSNRRHELLHKCCKDIKIKRNVQDAKVEFLAKINTASDFVDQELVFVGSESGKMVAFRELVQKGLTPPVLIFVQTKERAKELFSELIYDGINVDVIHADRTQLQRDNVVRSFREGKIWVLICTELMGRGIDFKGVNLVLNYDFPPSAISYIHRIGRTGRAGRRGKAITFFTEDDTVNLRSIAHILHDSGCNVPEYMLRLKKASKRARRTLEQRAPKRESISTVPTYQVEKDKKRKRKLKEVKQMTKEGESNRPSPTKQKKIKHC